MILRIRLQQGQPIQRKPGKNRHVALAFGSLMTPLALMAYVLGIWRLASDMGVAGESGITGVFSHWQVWIPAGAFLQIAGMSLSRYGRGGALKVPRILTFPGLPARERADEPAPKSNAK
ncbi:MAG: hypothetical protein LAO79_00195 [Acidobacteriia bacterium]|nr:hypothetical protein [Terriglobia bacterium]